MAVSSLQYTMGISSGFKVYILEGQHSSRDSDRLRPLSSRGIPVYPIKRKCSPEPRQLPKRVCPASSQPRGKVPPAPVSSQSVGRAFPPAPGPHASLEHVLRRLMPDRRPLEMKTMDQNQDEQPLALVKRKERPVDPAVLLQQNRPSVITCVSKPKPAAALSAEPPSPLRESHRQVFSRSPDVEEHFRRSLMSSSPRPNVSPPPAPARNPSVSVEDHFSKALGSRWLLIRAAADSPSSPEHRSLLS
ncbi:transcription cofactor vestigial-like protein 4 [Spea bombifrons]|uniref:transcription cofactor vestigial-like protein 4 n=1 Tax=Spea bombifrons TaxID=233779 RepID=UPI00234BABF6|nr:transcription cofactor vestigial-like protein 4 [Spea bombifrons]